MPVLLSSLSWFSANTASYAGVISIRFTGFTVVGFIYRWHSFLYPHRLQDSQTYTFRSDINPVLFLALRVKAYFNLRPFAHINASSSGIYSILRALLISLAQALVFAFS